ncbi:uncharacterized protein [Diabrotica undecimpunctata]|uniref:uncharacterized protein isoform X1 n=1 Tax=Diabrotica undecimpunctata TaxID=50387 RepID=UPI003B6400BE
MYLYQTHDQFLQAAVSSLKLDNNVYSVAPSVVFLSSTFALMYVYFSQYSYSEWQIGIYHNLVFHWAYFYIARIWLVMVKLARYLIEYMDKYIEENCRKDEILQNQVLTHTCIFFVMLILSMFPLALLIPQLLHSQRIPNFFTWIVNDNTRHNTEIGTSIPYLERPPNILEQPHKRSTAAYRSKISSSFINPVARDTKVSSMRISRSMMTVQRGTMT